MKDILKIYDLREKKQIKEHKENIKVMQENNEYPLSFNFPLLLQFELTSHCNVKCRHCYNNSGAFNTIQDRMTPEKWKNFARYLVSKGGIFECIVSGGEPLLLGDDLFDIMDILHDDGTRFLLITNGYLLNNEKIKKLSKYRYKWLQISIDGYNPEYHNWFRNREGSWERAVSGAIKVVEAGIPLTIAHSITAKNLDGIDEMCQLAYHIGASSIILGETNLSGRSYDNQDLVLNDKQREYLYIKTEENIAKYYGRMDVMRSTSTHNQLLKYQSSVTTGAIIRPDGNIRLDCMAPFIIGNILDDDFETVWKEKSPTCWHHKKLCEYIDSFNNYSLENSVLKNYVDEDILI